MSKKDKDRPESEPDPKRKSNPCTLCGGSGKVAGLTCRWCQGTGEEPD